MLRIVNPVSDDGVLFYCHVRETNRRTGTFSYEATDGHRWTGTDTDGVRVVYTCYYFMIEFIVSALLTGSKVA